MPELDQFEAVEVLEPEFRQGLADFFDEGIGFQVDGAIVKPVDGGCDVIADVTYSRPSSVSGTGDQRRTHTTRQTVVYFHRPEIWVPPFHAHSKRGWGGFFMSRLLRFVGAPLVKLPDHPKLTKRFSLISFHPDSTRAVLTEPTVDALLRHDNVTLQAEGEALVIFRAGELLLQPDQRAELYAAASSIAAPLLAQAAAHPVRVDKRGAEAVRTMQRLGGFLGSQLRGELVTQAQIDAFLMQAPPRAVPRVIRNLAYGWSRLAMILAIGFTLMGCVLTTGFAMGGVFAESVASWILLIMPLIGLLTFIFAVYWRRLRSRVLRHGRIVSAKVKSVESAGVVYGDEPQYEVHFVTDDAEKHGVSISIGAKPAKLARQIKKRGETVRLLVDPLRPTNGLWVDGWAMDAPA